MTDLLSVLSEARANVDRLSEPDVLRDAANEVARIAEDFGVVALVAATAVAERIVGAAVVMHAHRLRLFNTEASVARPDAVLVVDVNVASGTAMARRAEAVRQSGVAAVTGAVLYGLSEEVGPLECGVDRLAVLYPRPSTA